MNARRAGDAAVEYRTRSRKSGGLAEGLIGTRTKVVNMKRREPEFQAIDTGQS